MSLIGDRPDMLVVEEAKLGCSFNPGILQQFRVNDITFLI